MDQEVWLIDRIARLDQEAGGSSTSWPTAGLAHVIQVVDEITGTETAIETAGAAALPAPLADEIVGTSVLLARLRYVSAEVVDGPPALDRQFWIGTGKPSWVAGRSSMLNQREFDDASQVEMPASTKPFSVGLFTSTGLPGTHGLWELYIDTTQSTLFSRPWRLWRVVPRADVRLLEIPSAAAWAAFVCAYPRREGDLVFPDWRAVAADYDGVHLTLRAVVATQGLRFVVDGMSLAPVYWGVESTFWLHWCFTEVELLHVR